MWGSMKPGATSRREASIVLPVAGTRTDVGGPTSVTVAPSITNRPGENFCSGVRSVPASMARSAFLLTATSEVAQHAAKVSICGRELLLGIVAIAACRAHNYGDFQVGS